MDRLRLEAALPRVLEWMDATTAFHRGQGRGIDHYHFKRLPHFYSPELLELVTVVEVEAVPFPPLTAFGLPEFAGLESGSYSGITFDDTYFIRRDCAYSESVHFHELVHVVQWGEMGREPFLLAYAAGILAAGYEGSPLEAMAYELQERFSAGAPHLDVGSEVRKRLAFLRLSL